MLPLTQQPCARACTVLIPFCPLTTSEIILRPYQFCNLTEVVVRAGDDAHSLGRKVRLAAVLGTFQATLTTFPYLREVSALRSAGGRGDRLQHCHIQPWVLTDCRPSSCG